MAEAEQGRPKSERSRNETEPHDTGPPGNGCATAQGVEAERGTGAEQRQRQRHVGEVAAGGEQQLRHLDTEQSKRQRRHNGDDQRILDDAEQNGADTGGAAETAGEGDHCENVVEHGHRADIEGRRPQPLVAVGVLHIGEPDNGAVAAKAPLHEDAAQPLLPDKTSGQQLQHQIADNGGEQAIADKPEARHGGEVGTQNTEKEQSGQGDLKHQSRGGFGKGIRQQPQPLEQDAEQQHHADGACDGEGEEQTGQQIHDGHPVLCPHTLTVGQKGHSNAMGLYSQGLITTMWAIPPPSLL